MSQFRIKGIDYIDDSLQHGLGKGSGRGRPVGSKNGQVMPGAAYMKDYKVVGEKAEGDANQTQVTRRTSGGANRINPYGSGGRQQRTGTRVIGTTNARANNQQQSAGRARTATGTNRIASGSVITNSGRVIPTQDMRTKSTPAATTSKGKDAVTKMMEYNGTQMGSGRTTSNGAYKYDTPRPQQRVAEEVPAQQNSSQIHAPDQQVNKPINGQGKQNDNRIHAPDQQVNKPINGQGKQNDNRIHAPNQASGQQNQNQNQTQAQAQPFDAGRGDNGGIQPDRPVSDAGRGDTDSDRGSEETPEQKSFWDRLGGWFDQAGKDIGNTVSGAWNTATGAINDAAVWVGDRLKDGGEWALASMGDVGKWVGDRAKDLDHWWNGEDVEVNDNGHWRQGHRDGVREQIGNAANAAGQWIGNAAGDVGKAVDNAAGDVGRTVGDAANSVGQWIGNAANDVGTAVDEAWNGKQRTISKPGPNGNTIIENVREGGIRPGIENAVNAAGKWIGDQANAVGQGVSNFVNGVRPGEAQPYYDVQSGKWVDPTMPSLGERIQGGLNAAGQWIGDTANNAWNGVTGAANDVGQWVGNTANNAGQAIQNGWNTITGQNQNNQGTPFTQAASQQAQNVGNAVFGEQAQENPVLRFFNTSVLDPNFGANAADAWNQVTGQRPQQGNWFTNAMNGAGQWINDGVVTPVVNGFNSGVEFVRNGANDIANRVATGASTSRALDSGVAPSEVETYQRMLSDGSITPETYNNTMNSMANIQNIDRAAAQAGWDGIPADVREMNEKENNSLGQRIGNAAQNAWNGISDTAQNVANGVSNAAQNVWNGANEAYRNLVGGVYPVTNPDGTTHNLYYPTLKDAYDTVAGNNVPSYVEKYYDRSNPDREAYWPMTMQYIQRQDPTYFWSDPSSVFGFHPVNYAVAKYGNNPFEDKK